MSKYQRCSGGQCDNHQPDFPSLKPGGKKGDKADWVYLCSSNGSKPCPPAGSSCKCYLVLMHWQNVSGGEEITEEELHPGTPDSTKDDPYEAVLNNEKLGGRVVQVERPKGHGAAALDWWQVGCRCIALNTKGKPAEV